MVQPTVAYGADPVSAEGGKTECCINAAADIAQLHKSADRLYAHFKPKEAARELQKILLVDEQNLEALVKLSRAHIDIGDMISESSPAAQERKMKEYRIAEDYARKAIRANPNSTWGYFYVAGSLGEHHTNDSRPISVPEHWQKACRIELNASNSNLYNSPRYQCPSEMPGRVVL